MVETQGKLDAALAAYEAAKTAYDDYTYDAVGEDSPPLCAEYLRDASEAAIEALLNEVTKPAPAEPSALEQAERRERLADVSHEIWASWTRWQFGTCTRNEDGSLTIPAALVERWTRQMNTPYAELSEREKDSDREQADKILDALTGSAT